MIRHKYKTILGDIPSDWKAKPLASLLSDQLPGDWGDDEGDVLMSALRSTNFTDSGNLDVTDVAKRGFNASKAKQIQVQINDILVERSGGGPSQPVGRVAMIREEMPVTGFANFIQLFRPNPEEIDPDFLLWTLHQLNRSGFVERLQSQTTQMRNLDLRDYLRVLIPVPPDRERRGIAEAVRTADDQISALAQYICKTERVKKALMQTLFISGIPERNHELNTAHSVSFPRSWRLVRLGALLKTSEYGISDSFSAKGQYQILRMENVTDGDVHTREPVFIDLATEEYERYRVRKGDILFNRTNSWDLVGRVGIAQEDLNAVFASYLIRLTVKAEALNPFFLNYALNSPAVKQRYRRFVTPAVSQANINVRNLRQTWIAVPDKALSQEQDEIVEILKAVDKQRNALQVQLTAARRLKQSLLQNLVTGKIRLKP